ncbi:hypothetical protein [Bacteroides sp. 519]|uniref:hypothetical protein n=1 Tax=Bacteroides sp. 519 TaxID=2302937 RepID=UPI0013D5FBCD|nr:hypothetical protein [Bacteroides sp. 519]NDV59529.1 hypothetical protein [Bacteroides sp. 519]
MKYLLAHTFVFLFFGMFLEGCQNEDSFQEEPEKEAGLYLSIQPSGTVSTRAMKDSDIGEMTILYFRKNEKITGVGDDKYYLLDVEKIATGVVGTGTNNQLFAPKDGGKWTGPQYAFYPNMRVAVFANSHLLDFATTLGYNATVDGTAATTHPTTGIITMDPLSKTISSSSLEMENVLKSITFKNNVDTVAYVRSDSIPMYVLTGDVKIRKGPYEADYYVSTDGTSTQVYNLIRSVAKVKIENKKARFQDKVNSGLYHFLLDSVYVVKGNRKGYAYYDSSSSDHFNSDRVVEATVPTGASATKGGITSKTNAVPDTTKTSGTQTVSDFYLYEAKIANAGTTNRKFDSNNDCHLVIVGRREAATKGTYEKTRRKYMIPIPYLQKGDVSATTSYVIGTSFEANYPGSILRNHYYKFTIEGVGDRGLRIKLSIQNWTEVTIGTDPIPVS